jgi:hypothetical protein
VKARLALVALALCLAQTLPIAAQTAPTNADTEHDLQAMERKFFEHDFSKESMDYRVQRLEKFAFGQPSTGSVDARVAKLASVIDLHQNLVPPSVSLSTPPSYNEQDEDPSERGHYPHVTTLEQQILGQTYENDSLNARLSRLETKAFGKASTSNDSAERTDVLQDYAERTLHTGKYRINPKNDSTQVAQSQGAGNGSTKWVEDYRPTKRVVEPMASVLMGMFGLPNMSQMNMMAHAMEPDASDEDARPAPPPDPAIFKDVPPDAHARMITRVAWCEQHLFGQTYDSLHLQQRLRQLNATLFPQDHEPDIKLMDRLDVIVREIVMRQHPPIAYNR